MDFKDEKSLAWIVLFFGGVAQIGWSIGVDYTEQFTVWYWDIITVVFLAISMWCLEWPMKHGIAFTTAYAVWIGVGVGLTVIVSAILGLDDFNWLMAVFLIVVLAGVVGLKATPVEYLPPKEKKTSDTKEE
jgi:quaternary ammonium compound-resistance protein SugE